MIVIGITQSDSEHHLYEPWIIGNDSNIQVITLSYTDQNLVDIKKCNGIVLTGGVDSHPKFYNNARLDYPGADAFNETRDEFELRILDFALTHQLPVLGICRGMQLINIALGGNMIQDLEEKGKNNHRSSNGIDGVHEIVIHKSSLLYSIVKLDSGKVNSAHHQGLGRIAEELMISAVSPDEVPEAIEFKDKLNHGFLLGVQWHPERLDHNENYYAFSGIIRETFIQAAHNHALLTAHNRMNQPA